MSSALLLNASTMYLRSKGTDDSTGLNGIDLGRGGGLRRYPLVEAFGCLANRSRLKAAATGLRFEELLFSIYLNAGVGFGKDGGKMYVSMQARLLKNKRSTLSHINNG